MREIMLVLISFAAWASPAPGQAAPRGPVASVVLRDVARGPLSVDCSAAPRDSVKRDIRPTYWKEGALVAGLLGLGLGFLAGSAVCESGNACMTGAIIGGGLLLLIPGSLIGGQFPKGEVSKSPPD